jgi:hypothetical protein
MDLERAGQAVPDGEERRGWCLRRGEMCGNETVGERCRVEEVRRRMRDREKI